MRGRNSGAVAIFIGALLIVIFAVGLAVDGNPNALMQKYRYDLSIEQFGVFFRFLFECFSVALSLFQDVLAAVGDGLFEKGI